MTKNTLTIWSVDDDIGEAEILRRNLEQLDRWTIAFRHITDAEEAVDLAPGADFDVLFLDYHMGSFSGSDCLKALRAQGEMRPIVVLTGRGDEYAAAELTRAGADHYIIKRDLTPHTLECAIQQTLQRYRDRTQEAEIASRFEEMSNRIAQANLELADATRRDPLTQLFNRSAWNEAMALEQDRASEHGHHYAVILLDIDYFKMLNDSRGHQAGDDCLQQMASRLTKSVRPGDVVSRYGGEEFVVLLPNTDMSSAREVAEELRRAIWDLKVPHPASPIAERVTISLGVAIGPLATFEEVVKGADEALYAAKASGRNRVCTEAMPNRPPADTAESAFTILAIDDDPGDVELLQRNLEQIDELEFDLLHCTTADGGRSTALEQPVNLIFLDYNLGHETGLEALTAIRSAGYLGPVIVLTGQGDEYIATNLTRAGADDYIVKGDLTPEVIRRAIQGANAQYSRRIVEQQNHSLLDELQQAKASLEAKNRRLAELYDTAHRFVDNVSHEFRTPLAVIKEYGAIMRDGLLGEVNEEQREYLDIVLNRVNDLTTMVNDMLDISKLEAGLLGTRREVCEVNAVIERVRPILERKAAIAKVEMKVPATCPGSPLYCDTEKIGRVIINLVTNAIKFCGPRGHVEVWVRPDADRAETTIGVTDNGPGIAAQDLEAIFMRFKQVEGSARSSTKGFGLGLSIAKELVQLNLGEIMVESTLGQGSTFFFTVPTADRQPLVRRYLRLLRTTMPHNGYISLITVRAEEGVAPEILGEVNSFLHHQLRPTDLLFQTGPAQWAVLLAGTATNPRTPISRWQTAFEETNRNRPMGALPELAFDIELTRCVTDNEADFINDLLRIGELAVV